MQLTAIIEVSWLLSMRYNLLGFLGRDSIDYRHHDLRFRKLMEYAHSRQPIIFGHG